MTHSDQRHCGATQPLSDDLGDWICMLPSGHDGDHQALDGDPWPHTWPRDYDLLAPPPLPEGADPELLDDWQLDEDGKPFRIVWSAPFDKESDLRVCAYQRLTGEIVSAGTDAPEVFAGSESWQTADARRYAEKLIAAADLADAWAKESTR